MNNNITQQIYGIMDYINNDSSDIIYNHCIEFINDFSDFNESEYNNIHLITGPMFSCKTTTLINFYQKLQKYLSELTTENNVNIHCFNYSGDTRYDSESGSIVSHNHKHIDSIPIDDSKLCLQYIDNCNDNDETTIKHIFIFDEGQFLKNLDEVTDILTTKNTFVVICALDYDFKRNWFPITKSIYDKANHIYCHKSICHDCKLHNAIYSFRTVKNDSIELIGSDDKYVPMCNTCYEKNNKY